MSKPHDIPAGFEPLDRTNSPFLTALGPLYIKGEGSTAEIGLRVEHAHLNTRGVAHGGMLVTLADSALGIVLHRIQSHPMATVSLTADFAGAARAGDFVEARVDVQRLGGRLAFASCYLWVKDKRILRASAVFARLLPPAKIGEGT